ncbi:hypothetical protein [Dactylosporangium sp. CA-092794]|uniref:hypothetical protein n=1 Tax=Dactylosporangium sp. CA-092794 TaxID=3239929 RepID=UPI003D8EEF73
MIRRLFLLAIGSAVAALIPTYPAVAAPDDVVKVAVVRPPEQNGGRPDSLDQIAQRTLGDAGRATEILNLNRGRPQSDGGALGDDGAVRPGWILQLPDDADGPDVRLGRIGSAAVPAKPFFTWKVVLALIGAVILALITALMVFRRRIVRAARERFRTSAESARLRRRIQLGARMRVRLAAEFAADRAGPVLASRAAAELAADRVEAYALQLGPQQVTAWVAADHVPQAPWRAVSDEVWTRPAAAGGGAVPSGAVAPCLVRAGGDEQGVVYVDLTWLDGVLAIEGDTQVAADLLGWMIGDVTRFRPDLFVVSVPGRHGEPAGVPPEAIRLRSATDLRLPGPAAEGDDGIVRLAARRRALAGLVVVADRSDSEEAAHLLAACGPGSGQVALVLGDVPGAHWRWTAHADGSVSIPAFGITVTAPSR